MLKFMWKISEVIVNGISLVLKWQNPAVAHAGTKFAILKTVGWEDIQKFEAIEKKYRNIADEDTGCGPLHKDEK